MKIQEVKEFCKKHQIMEVFLCLHARNEYGGNINQMLYMLDIGLVPNEVERVITEEKQRAS